MPKACSKELLYGCRHLPHPSRQDQHRALAAGIWRRAIRSEQHCLQHTAVPTLTPQAQVASWPPPGQSEHSGLPHARGAAGSTQGTVRPPAPVPPLPLARWLRRAVQRRAPARAEAAACNIQQPRQSRGVVVFSERLLRLCCPGSRVTAT